MCDFTTSAKNGVSVHKGHMHKDIKTLLDDKHNNSLNVSEVSNKREEIDFQLDNTDLRSIDYNEEVNSLQKTIREKKC